MNFAKKTFPHNFENRVVLDIGSGDINGTNRGLFSNCEYHGNDVAPAKNVTIVCKTSSLPFDDEYFDTIVSTECFEHDPEYSDSIRTAYRMLKPGGLLAFTCASTGRTEHGTRRTTPHDSIGTLAEIDGMVDYYKNLSHTDIIDIFDDMQTKFSSHVIYFNAISRDLYFLGMKINDDSPIVPTSPIPTYTAPGVKKMK